MQAMSGLHTIRKVLGVACFSGMILIGAGLPSVAVAEPLVGNPICGDRGTPFDYTCSIEIDSAVTPAFSDQAANSIDFEISLASQQGLHIVAPNYIMGIRFNGNLTTSAAPGSFDAIMVVDLIGSDGNSVLSNGAYETFSLHASGGDLDFAPESSSFFGTATGDVVFNSLLISFRPYTDGSTVQLESFSSFDFYLLGPESGVLAASVPEPATLALVGLGLGGIVSFRRGRHSRPKKK